MIPRVVMVGIMGCGKTTLLNKICNQKLYTYCGGRQDTKEPIISNSAYGKGFLLLEAPGLNAGYSKLNISIGILKCLIDNPINQLLVVCSFGSLDFFGYLNRMVRIFKKYKDIITVVITFFDLSHNQLEDRKEIMNYLKNRHIESVIFTSQETQGEELCKQIDIKNTNLKQTRTIELMQQEILLNFTHPDYEDDCMDFEMEEAQSSLMLEFRQIRRILVQQIQEFPITHPKISEVMYEIIQRSKDQANNKFDEFKKKNSNLFCELSKNQDKDLLILIDFHVKSALIDEMSEIINKALEKIQKCESSYINSIIQCPYCGEIWMMDQGCKNKYFLCGGEKPLQQEYFIRPKLGCGQQLRWDEKISFARSFVQEATQLEVQDYLISILAQQEDQKIKLFRKIQYLINEKKIIFV